MTIIYQYKVATTSLGGFAKLLAAWRGSVYKLMYKEMLIFAGAYFIISLTYRLALTPDQKLVFEKIVIHCNTFTSLIPVSFVLGFYVSFVVKRWWEQFMNVPWPDRTLFVMNTYLHSDDDRARIMRRTVARYMLLGLIIICRSVSVAVMKRFPTMDHLIEAGFATKEEIEMFENTKCKYNKFWVPLMWANNILIQARRERKIDNDFGLRMIIEQLATFRDRCSLCFVYDWITIPLVYTQVATLAVYMFFATCLLGRQFLEPDKNYTGYDLDLYFPLFTFLQFFFYMGWLKVAEQLINPFGEDDDDFDINWLLDRHTEVAFSLVDQCYGKYPNLVQDKFWNDEVVPDLPYTEASLNSKKPNFLGSTYNLSKPPSEDQRLFIPQLNSNGVGIRHRRQNSYSSNIGDSVLSLIRGNSIKSYHDSNNTLSSYTGHEKMLSSLSNGGPGYNQLPVITINDQRQRRASIDVPKTTDDDVGGLRRERSSTDCDQRQLCVDLKPERERKFSTPFNFPFFSREDKKREEKKSDEASIPKSSRFSVEPVVGDLDQEDAAPRARRSGQIMCQIEKHMKHNNAGVSRPPVLSAIEEGGTVTSIRQLLPATSDSETSDPFDDSTRRSSIAFSLDDDIPDIDELEEMDETTPMYNYPIPQIVIEEC